MHRQKQPRPGTYTNAGHPKNQWLKSWTSLSAVNSAAVKKQPNHRIFAANNVYIHRKIVLFDAKLHLRVSPLA